MIIKEINNSEEITIEDKTYIRVESDGSRDCNECAFDNIDIGCRFADCDGYIYILKDKVGNE